nr:unnamed protein product [Callosobruchus chinensis]
MQNVFGLHQVRSNTHYYVLCGVSCKSQDTASDIISGCSQSSSSIPTTPSFKRPRNKADQLLDKIAKRMEHPVIEIPSTRCSADKLRQPHEAFGEYIAEKLRSIPPSMVPYCQKLINDAVFFAELEKLNDSMARPCVTPIIWTLAEWTRPKCPGPNGSAVSGGLRAKCFADQVKT